MIGVAFLVLAFLLGIPVLLMSLGALAALLGTCLKLDAEERHTGSELIALNK